MDQQEIKVPVITLEDNAGNKYTFMPAATVLDTSQLIVQLLEQTAIEISIQPGLTPSPLQDHLDFVKTNLREQVERGAITQEQSDKIDPVFQAKYEMNFQNLISSLISCSADRLIKHYGSLKIIQSPGSGGNIITAR